ncbi:MAG: hypothetical protein IT348_13390 [Candidatus Eisenbacteria bacterium]|nr:hypothetical protein [Candidatus Eisenbacteria bacterium]
MAFMAGAARMAAEFEWSGCAGSSSPSPQTTMSYGANSAAAAGTEYVALMALG